MCNSVSFLEVTEGKVGGWEYMGREEEEGGRECTVQHSVLLKRDARREIRGGGEETERERGGGEMERERERERGRSEDVHVSQPACQPHHE